MRQENLQQLMTLTSSKEILSALIKKESNRLIICRGVHCFQAQAPRLLLQMIIGEPDQIQKRKGKQRRSQKQKMYKAISQPLCNRDNQNNNQAVILRKRW